MTVEQVNIPVKLCCKEARLSHTGCSLDEDWSSNSSLYFYQTNDGIAVRCESCRESTAPIGELFLFRKEPLTHAHAYIHSWDLLKHNFKIKYTIRNNVESRLL